MLKIRYHSQFKKDYKLIVRRNYDISKLEKVIAMLAEEVSLPQEYRNHSLSGNYMGFMECHIEPDWLLVYQINGSELTLVLSRTGTHSDLFKK